MTVQVIHKNSSVQNQGVIANQIQNGELAINFHESGPFVQLKDTLGQVVRVGGVILSETQPALNQKGAFWLKPSTARLYIANGTTWLIVGGVGGGGSSGDIPTKTSDLTNDGADGINPFITMADVTALPTPNLQAVTDSGDSTNNTIEVAGLIAANLTYPTSDGTSGQVIVTDGSGNLSWADQTGTGATVDLGYTADPNKGTVTNTSGTDAVIPVVTNSSAGLMTPDEKITLENLEITVDDIDVGEGTITINNANGDVIDSFNVNQDSNQTITIPGGTGGAVDQIVAGTNVTISPTGGTGIVTINASGGSGATNLGYTADAAEGTVTSDTGTDAVIPAVDSTNAGLMTPTQKAKLDDAAETGDIGNATLTITQGGVSKGTFTANASTPVTIDLAGGGSGSTDLSYTAAADKGTVNSSTGTNADIPVVDGTNAGLMTPSQKQTLDDAPTNADLSLKADLVNGVIPTSQLPAIAISQFLGTVDSEAAMLALVGETGDYCIRSDLSTTWIISGPDGTVIGNWTQIVTPTSPVESVNGQTGVVVLSPADIGAATAAEGALALTALQPSDNISELTNDSNYLVKGSINPVLYAKLADLPAASDNHGGVAHVHETGLEYYAHAGSWIALAKASDITAQVQSDWTETDSSAVSYIQNKPTISAALWKETSNVLEPESSAITSVEAKAFHATGGTSDIPFLSENSDGDGAQLAWWGFDIHSDYADVKISLTDRDVVNTYFEADANEVYISVPTRIENKINADGYRIDQLTAITATSP